jgi:hypothetical protein
MDVHETIRLPELRAAAVFREHPLREPRLSLGYFSDHDTLTALKPRGNIWIALADPCGNVPLSCECGATVCNVVDLGQ